MVQFCRLGPVEDVSSEAPTTACKCPDSHIQMLLLTRLPTIGKPGGKSLQTVDEVADIRSCTGLSKTAEHHFIIQAVCWLMPKEVHALCVVCLTCNPATDFRAVEFLSAVLLAAGQECGGSEQCEDANLTC